MGKGRAAGERLVQVRRGCDRSGHGGRIGRGGSVGRGRRGRRPAVAVPQHIVERADQTGVERIVDMPEQPVERAEMVDGRGDVGRRSVGVQVARAQRAGDEQQGDLRRRQCGTRHAVRVIGEQHLRVVVQPVVPVLPALVRQPIDESHASHILPPFLGSGAVRPVAACAARRRACRFRSGGAVAVPAHPARDSYAQCSPAGRVAAACVRHAAPRGRRLRTNQPIGANRRGTAPPWGAIGYRENRNVPLMAKEA